MTAIRGSGDKASTIHLHNHLDKIIIDSATTMIETSENQQICEPEEYRQKARQARRFY